MRVDKFLHLSRLTKTRSDAKKACELGYVFINDKRAKASSPVKPGDILLLNLPKGRIRAQVLKLPSGRGLPARERPDQLVKILEDNQNLSV